MKRGRQTVFPIFYDVEPSHVRKQTGGFGKAFDKHEEDFGENCEKLQRWRLAMKEVASLSGWDLQNRDESEFIQDFVQEILSKLRNSCHRFSTIDKDLVGMNSHLEKMSLYLCIRQLNDVRIIGICGMGGIGKTTIARVAYEKMSCHFEGSSFISDVRDFCHFEKHGLVRLQEQLISETMMDRNIKIWDAYRGKDEIRNRLRFRRVIIVLDDVDKQVHLEYLAGDRNWFGTGSRIIITTRDEHLLKQFGVDQIYKVEELGIEEALQLFCLKAFKNDCNPPEDYVQFSNHVVKYAGGLPLALNVLGSFLCERSLKEWKSALDRLKKNPNKDILDKLQISYDGLGEVEKTIFLDIACFFNRKSLDYVMKILECSGFYPDIGIAVLTDKSLIKISAGEVWMHDLLQEMGQKIIQQESQEPGQRSRLWLYNDVSDVFMNNAGTEQVKGIVLDSFYQERVDLSAKAFSNMKRLRLLILKNLDFCQSLEYLSNELRYFEWQRYPFKYLPLSFQPPQLVEFHMPHSSIEEFWERIQPLEMLKVIDLSYSRNLIKTPDFRGVPNLEKLILQYCHSLFEIHQSIGVLKRLVLLNLKGCINLVGFPSSIFYLMSLEVLTLYGCSKLGKACKGTTPKSWYSLLPSQLLARNNPSPMTLIFPCSTTLSSLKHLDLSYCNLEEIPIDLSRFPLLTELFLGANKFVSIPASIGGLSKLKSLSLHDCQNLQSLPILPKKLRTLFVHNCTSLKTVPNLYEECLSRRLWFSFTHCTSLIDYQKTLNAGLAWLEQYLFNMLVSRKDDQFSSLAMCSPGSEIPGWFNYQRVQDSLRIPLPPKENWYKDYLMGFAVCAVFEGHYIDDEVSLMGCNTIGYRCAGITTLDHGFRSICAISDHYQIFLMPRCSCSGLQELSDPIELDFHLSNSRKKFPAKKWGFRMVYEQDIKELMQSNNPFQNLAPPYNFKKP